MQRKKQSAHNLDKNKRDMIVVWSEVAGSLTLKEKEALLKFGNKYGEVAMRRQAEGWLADKKPQPEDKTERLKTGLSFLNGLKKIWQVGRVRKKKKKQSLDKKRRDKFIRGFSEVAEPLMKSMLTMAFSSQVLERYLSLEEQKQLNRKLKVGAGWSKSDFANLIKLIEARSGSSLDEIIADVRREVEQDMFEVWVANWEDMKTLSRDPDCAKKLEKEMNSGNLESVARELMKGGRNGWI